MADTGAPRTATAVPAPGRPPGRATAGVGAVETHSAVLFFAGERVYKAKKSVDLGFLDFRDPAARRAACEAEVRLNRRLAPDVYEGVGAFVGPDGDTWEHLVVMRRMPDDRRLSRLVRDGADVTPGLREVARLVADFHARCERSDEPAAAGGPGTLEPLWRANLDALRSCEGTLLGSGTVTEMERMALAYLEGRRDLLRARQEAGLVRDGHGDLLADDVFLLDDGPRILDCLDFDPALRHGDVLLDVAFLVMDLERLGARDAAARFLREYQDRSGERHPPSLAHHYVAYRATVRAKVAAVRLAQGDVASAEDVRCHARLALDHLRRGEISLVLVGGLPGTGKSTVARALVDPAERGPDAADGLAPDDTGWTLVRSDVVRKELAGLRADEGAAAAPGTGLYRPEVRRRTYEEMFGRARDLLGLGRSVVLDASFTGARERADAAALAHALSARLVQIECRAPTDVVARRLARRGASPARDASDADIAVHRALAATAAPWPDAVVLDTDAPPDVVAGRGRAIVAERAPLERAGRERAARERAARERPGREGPAR